MLQAIVEEQADGKSAGPICRASAPIELPGSRHRHAHSFDDARTGRRLSDAILGERSRPGPAGGLDPRPAAGYRNRRLLRRLGAMGPSNQKTPSEPRPAPEPSARRRSIRTCRSDHRHRYLLRGRPSRSPWRTPRLAPGDHKLAGRSTASLGAASIPASSLHLAHQTRHHRGRCRSSGGFVVQTIPHFPGEPR